MSTVNIFVVRYSDFLIRLVPCYSTGYHRSDGLSSFSSGNMSDKSMWEKFYASRPKDESFDWFIKFDDVKEHVDSLLSSHITSVPRILDIGCGTSDFSVDLLGHLRGKCRIDGVDFSEQAIKQMHRHAEKTHGLIVTDSSTGLFYCVADVKDLPFCDGTFLLAVDKGTGDAVLRGPDGERNFVKVVAEAVRVLETGGNLAQFSDEPPEIRMPLLEKVGFSCLKKDNINLRVYSKELGVHFGVEHFMYVVCKEKSK